MGLPTPHQGPCRHEACRYGADRVRDGDGAPGPEVYSGRCGVENWREVSGWPYWASDLGQIWSVRSQKLVIGSLDQDGYRWMRPVLEGRVCSIGVHQAVALAFIGPVPEGQEVRHLDGDVSNNRPTNLRYGTSSENKLDNVRNGTHHQARQTHCKNNHPLIGENVYLEVRSRGVARKCRTCRREWARQRRTHAGVS